VVHEWALAEAIADYLQGLMRREGREGFRRAVIRLGTLQSIDREVLRFSLTEVLKYRGVAVEELVFRDEEAVFRCRRCGATWTLKDLDIGDDVREAMHFIPEVIHSYFKCPKCGSRDFEVVRGRGVYIEEAVFK